MRACSDAARSSFRSVRLSRNPADARYLQSLCFTRSPGKVPPKVLLADKHSVIAKKLHNS